MLLMQEKKYINICIKKQYEGLSGGKIAPESVWVVISIRFNLKTLPFPSTKQPFLAYEKYSHIFEGI